MTTVTNTLRHPTNGSLVAGAHVTVRLVVGNADGSGYVPADSAAIQGPGFTRSNEAGVWSMDLEPNSGIQPANTYYQVVERHSGVTITSTIAVPDDDEPQWLYNLLITEPPALVPIHETAADPHPQYLRQAEADALYDDLGAAATGDAAHVGAADPHPQYDTAAEVSAAITVHAALSDPHPIYLTATEGNAAYDALGAATTATAAHLAASDPHPQYYNTARGAAAFDALGAAAAALASASSALATHEADTTSIHGITDTAQLAIRNAANTFSSPNRFTDDLTFVQGKHLNFEPDDSASFGTFNTTLSGFVNSFSETRKDQVFRLGYNLGSGGVPIVSGQHSWGFELESFWAPDAATRQVEAHLAFQTPGGAMTIRPITVATHISSVAGPGWTNVGLRADQLDFLSSGYNAAGIGTQILRLTPTQLDVQADLAILFETNNPSVGYLRGKKAGGSVSELLRLDANDFLALHNGGDVLVGNNLIVKSGKFLEFAGNTTGLTPDVLLRRDAANTLSMRNGANGQAFRLYKADDGSGNTQYGELTYGGSRFQIGSRATGTGVAGDISIYAGGAEKWRWNGTSGDFVPLTTDNVDIGTSAGKVKTVYSRDLSINTGAFGSGVGVVGIANATTVPSSNPASGVVLYAESGLLKWRSSAGVITDLSDVDLLSTAQTLTALKTFQAGAAATVVAQARVAADAVPRLAIGADGKLSWSDGALAADTILARGAAARLDLTGAFQPSGQILAAALGSDSTPDIAFAVAPTMGFRRFGTAVLGVVIGGSARTVFNGGSVEVASTGKFSWAQSSAPNDTEDLILTRAAIGSLNIGGQANGQLLGIKTLTELTTIAATATTDTTIQLPAGAIILAVTTRVTVAIPTATTFTVGDSGNASRFSTAAISTTANTTDKGSAAGAFYNPTATAVRITPNSTPGANTGRVRVTVHYLDPVAATS